MTPLRDDLFATLRADGPTTAGDAAAIVGTTPEIARAALLAMIKCGHVRRCGRAKSKITGYTSTAYAAVPSDRDQNVAIGAINSTALGASRLSRQIAALLQRESPIMIVVPGTGEVYAIDPTGLRARATADKEPGWIVGVYTQACDAVSIAEDLRVRARELRRIAA
jgi:hypothetical protein